jgi:hypothetical protein
MTYRKTPIAARELGVPYYTLYNLIRFNKVDPPLRDTSGHFVWTDSDLERTRKALAAIRHHNTEVVS